MTTYIDIDPDNGLSVPEGLVPFTVESIVYMIQTGEEIGRIGQNELILGIRLAVAQGRIKDIAFRFEQCIIQIKPNGKQDFWPKNFPGSIGKTYLMDLINSSCR